MVYRSCVVPLLYCHFLKVSEKRKVQLNEYLQSLLKMDSIVAEVLYL